jgi:hypothetical protein
MRRRPRIRRVVGKSGAGGALVTPTEGNPMRMMMKISIPIEAANQAVEDGSAQRILKTSLETLRPEAAYFYPDVEGRTILLFIDVKEPSDMPLIGEPFFKGLKARVTFTPVMNGQDFQAGMAKLAR